jgi:multiple sugar transport system permease protein
VWRIVLLLIAPRMAAAAVIAFFHGWNVYVFAQTRVSRESLWTASVGLAGFVGGLSSPVHTVMSIPIIYTVPVVVFLFVCGDVRGVGDDRGAYNPWWDTNEMLPVPDWAARK